MTTYAKNMQVSFEYAEEHLVDLVTAVDAGQIVEILRPEKPLLQLVTSPTIAPSYSPSRRGLFGSAKGMIKTGENWDSDETNDEIEQLFYGQS